MLLDTPLYPRRRSALLRSLARDRSDQHLVAARTELGTSRTRAAIELLRAWAHLPGRLRPLAWIPLLATQAGAGSVGRKLARNW
jgi:hypothetical protein